LTPAQKDWNHLRLVIDNNPHIPSRSRAYLYKEDSPVSGMVESCSKLEHYPVDLIAVPCNSATFYINEVQAQIGIPILNILEVTSQSVKNKLQQESRVAVLGGNITYLEKMYRPFLEAQGFLYIDHSEDEQSEVLSFIEYIKKNGNADLNRIQKFINKYSQKNKVDGIVLGCTEFGCLSELDSTTTLIDSTTELAAHIVSLAYKK
jgi:aspartate racemase